MTLMLCACTGGQKSDKPQTSITPVVSLVEPPTVAFESKPGATVATYLRAKFVNEGVSTIGVVDGVTFTLLDEKGKPFKVINECVSTKLSPGKPVTLKEKTSLTQEEFTKLASIEVSFICPTYGAVNTGSARDLSTVEKTKTAFVNAEELRVREERIAAWRARFSTTDYSDTILIGDSIMDNARSVLEETLPGVDIDADSGRTLEEGGLIREHQSPNDGVLDHIRHDDGTHERYVIGTGNNDPGGVSEGRAEEMVESLGPDKQIYFITEMVTANSTGTDTTNASIDAMVAKYPNVHKIDWHGLVEGHESEYLSDWCHPRSSKNPEYAALIKKGLDTVYDL